MKDKIEEICNKLNREQLSVFGATNELLDLFSVSKRHLIESILDELHERYVAKKVKLLTIPVVVH